MTPESILIISILIRSVAAGWSIVVAFRLKDWRILILTVMVVLMALRASLTLAAGVVPGAPMFVELPGLAVSVMALFAVVLVERIVQRHVAIANSLRKSHERYRGLVEDHLDLVCRFLPDGTLTFVNRAYADYFGRRIEDLVGTSFMDLIPTDEHDRIRQYLAEFGPAKTTSVIAHEALLPSGDKRWTEWTDRAFVDERGIVTSMQSIGRDVTERKKAEDALRHSEELNRRIIEALPGGLIHIDRDGQIVRMNALGQRMLGVSEEQATSVNITNLEPWTVYESGVTCPTHDFPATRCLRTGERQPPTVLGTLRPTGEISWAVFSAVPVTDPDTGQLDGAVVTFLDITDRKVAEEALRDSEANQRAIVQAVPDVMFRLTKDGLFRDYIPASGFETMLAPEAFLGKFIHGVHPPGLAARSMKAIRDALLTGDLQSFEYELDVPKGRRHFEARFVPDRTESVLCLIRDISDRREAEIQREELFVELEAKNTELERFARTVSHDLKSPLITIRGFMEVLEDDRALVSERAAQAIDRINNAARTMLHLLDDLLELARVGRLVNPPEEVPFGELARAAVDQVAGRIVRRAVEVQIESDMPVVMADRTRIVQVMQNLIDNAVKFMGDQANPRIEIGARVRNGDVICWVKDNGSGIDRRNLDRVFGVFDRLHRDVEGSGIGLALARRIIEVHGGKIWVESEGMGLGSTFFFTLPADPPKDLSAPSSAG